MVVNKEEMGGIMEEERSDMMMMMVVPTHHFQQETNHLYCYCFPYLIRKFTKLTSDVYKGVFYDCWREVNKVDEHQLFGGIPQ